MGTVISDSGTIVNTVHSLEVYQAALDLFFKTGRYEFLHAPFWPDETNPNWKSPVILITEDENPYNKATLNDMQVAAETFYIHQYNRSPESVTYKPGPPRKVEKLPGRNDLCPCKSGKKFKNCHINNVKELQAILNVSN